MGFDLDGRLWVERAVAAKSARVADVYQGGRWIARAVWPAGVYLSGYVVRDRTALGIAVDTDGAQRPVRLVLRAR